MSNVHPIVQRIADGIKLPINKVEAVLNLSGEGATVAFMARYRKEQTGNLDEVNIRDILAERDRIMELLDRQQTIIKSIEEQNKLTPELKAKILSTFDKVILEDIYAPYKKKKKTKADIARDLGFEAFADSIFKQRIEEGDYLKIARNYLSPEKGITEPEQVVEHTLYIIIEMIAHDVELKKNIRNLSYLEGFVTAKKAPRFKEEHSKFDTYFNYKEKIQNLINPRNTHRILAILRGFNEKALTVSVEVDQNRCLEMIRATYIKNPKSIFLPLMQKSVELAYSGYIAPSVEVDIFNELKSIADKEAITVFSKNAKDLLLQSPLGDKVVLGIDPGFRTGCKVAVVGRGGELLDHITIYPIEPHNKVDDSETIVKFLIEKHNVTAVAIGNGTASREAEQFMINLVKKENKNDLVIVVVNESGASIYSASDLAREELPNLDITYRGAVSIARRLQDPLAELVKIDPKSIGVGQYQHDVDQKHLQETLTGVVEDCVNFVGVDLNTASPQLLSYVSGIGLNLARTIVTHRNTNGLFKDRNELLSVPRLGEKLFVQSAGFLRIRNGVNLLDNTGVHPERYSAIQRICEGLSITVESILGDNSKIDELFLDPSVVSEFGEFTVKDIIQELKKPGRDPRKEFKRVEFHQSITKLEDVKPGMVLTGVIGNITNFGVFVDVGVHEHGLVHISELSDDGFISDPRNVVNLGDEVKVRVIGVDLEKKQLSLSMKKEKVVPPSAPARPVPRNDSSRTDKHGTDYRSDRRPQHHAQGTRHNQQPPRREERPPRVNPNSPFASLMAIRDKLGKK